MAESFLSLIDKVTLPLKYKIILAFGTGTLLLLPRSWTNAVLGFEITGVVRITIGVVFIVFFSFSVVESLIEIAGRGIRRRRNRAAYENQEKGAVQNFLQLSGKELSYMALFQLEDSISVQMPFNDGIVAALVSKGLIQRASNVSFRGFEFPFNISPTVWNYIHQHPEILAPFVRHIIEQRGSY